MTDSATPPRASPAAPDEEPSSAPAHGADAAQPPRSDFVAALLWIAFGVAVAIAAWRMDRLESQDINPYTIPGLLPGFLGLALILFGGVMLIRSWRAGALTPAGRGHPNRMTASELRRFGIITALCVAFGVGLVGHGLPFWAAASLYVATTIATLQYPQRKAAGQVVRGIVVAIVIGLCAGWAITLVFQDIFLVRLP
jgi:hypothetical protein